MSSPEKPSQPDPYKTAGAQTDSNIQTGIANSVLGNPNVIGPTGTTTYAQSGEVQTITGPDGKSYQVPRYTQTNKLSEPEQKVYDLNAQARTNVGQIGVDQSAKIGELLGKPVDLSGLTIDPNSFSQDRARVEQSLRDRMASSNQRRLDAERTRLTNSGFQQGTSAWNEAMDDYNRGINDQELGIIGRGLGEQQGMYGMASSAAQQEMQRRLQERNQPINEITALMSGSQVSMPNTPGYNPGQVAGTDVSGNVYNSAALANQQYMAEQQKQGAMLGGLFGMAGTAGMAGMKYGFNPMKWGGA